VIKPDFQGVVRQEVCPLRVTGGIVVICQGWPCWLTAALALGLPVVDVFCSQHYHEIFLSAGWNLKDVVFHNLVMFRSLMIPQDHWVLASGDIEFFLIVQAKMQWYQARFLFSVDVRFDRYRPRDLLRHYEKWAQDHARMGLGLPSYGMLIVGESLQQFTMSALVTPLTSPPYMYHACQCPFTYHKPC